MIKRIVIMSELRDVSVRTVSKKGSSKAITIPPGWATLGEKVCVTVKDEDTLIVTKSLHG